MNIWRYLASIANPNHPHTKLEQFSSQVINCHVGLCSYKDSSLFFLFKLTANNLTSDMCFSCARWTMYQSEPLLQSCSNGLLLALVKIRICGCEIHSVHPFTLLNSTTRCNLYWSQSSCRWLQAGGILCTCRRESISVD